MYKVGLPSKFVDGKESEGSRVAKIKLCMTLELIFACDIPVHGQNLLESFQTISKPDTIVSGSAE